MALETLFDVRMWMVFVTSICTYLFVSRRSPVFPIVNEHPRDFLGRKTKQEYGANATTLITEGIAKHGGPITLAIPHGRKIVLPSSLSSWVKSNEDLDHRELVRQDFFTGLPGFEALNALHASGDMLLDVIMTKLWQNDSLMPVMNASIVNALYIVWGEENSWQTIDWQKDTTAIIARTASSVFVGPEKANDQEWLDIVQGYVRTYFKAVSELHEYPPWSRPMVQRFLPNATACRKYVVRARVIINEVLEKRREDTRRAEREGRSLPEYNDALAWTQAVSENKSESGDIQLSLAMAAFFTTSELFRQVLIDVASHPEIIEPLRDEVLQQFSAHGVSGAATNKMVLLDSVLKESQRLSAPLAVLERFVTKDTKLPTGKVLPRGSHIMVDSTYLWNPAHYPNPYEFDGYRFLYKREKGYKFGSFVQSGPGYSVFGGGRHICPGRFFASYELKLAMAHVLLKYNIRLAKGYTSKPLYKGVYKVVDPVAQFEVRRRQTTAVDIV